MTQPSIWLKKITQHFLVYLMEKILVSKKITTSSMKTDTSMAYTLLKMFLYVPAQLPASYCILFYSNVL